jgi:GTP-binding protein HflX
LQLSIPPAGDLFIRDLPKDLISAFKATLEELKDADLLLHIVDISNPRFEQHIVSVERILSELSLSDKKRFLVFNKIDRLNEEEAKNIAIRFQGIAISALDNATFKLLLDAIEEAAFNGKLASLKV